MSDARPDAAPDTAPDATPDARPDTAPDAAVLWRARAARAGKLLTGNVLYLAMQALSLAVITRSSDGAVDAADFLLAQAVATPIAALVSGRIRDQYATGPIGAAFAPRMRRLGGLAVALGLVSTLGWLLVAADQRRWVGVAVLWANLAQIVALATQGRAIRRDEPRYSSLVDVMLGALSLGSMIVGYWWGGLVHASVLLGVTWTVFAAVLAWSEIRRDAGDGLNGALDAGSSWRDDLGVGLSAMAMMAQPSAARIGVSAFAGPLALAQFGTVSQASRFGSLLMGAARSASSIELADLKEQGRFEAAVLAQIRRLRRATAAFALLGAVLGAVAGPTVVVLIFSESVRPDWATCAWVFGGIMPLYGAMLLNHVGIAANQTNPLLFAGVIGLAATVVLVAPLAATWGASGGAAAVAVGYSARYLALDRLVGGSLHSALPQEAVA